MNHQSEAIDVQRCERAAAFLPARFMPRLTGYLIDGYWLDDHRYFFSTAEADANGRMVSRAKIADAKTSTVTPALTAEDLAALVSGHAGKQVDAAALAGARYDMPEAGRLVITVGSNAYHVAIEGPSLVRVETMEPSLALHSPNGRYAAFLKDYAVWVKDRTAGKSWQLTPDGEPYHAYGVMPESGLSPLKGRRHALPDGLWSPDSTWFVTHRIDERHLRESALLQNVPPGGKRPEPHVFKVSSPDAELATAVYVAYHLPSGRTISAADHPVQIGSALPPFVFKQCWFVAESLFFLDWNRFASEVTLVEMPLDGGRIRDVLTQRADRGWLDLHPRANGQPIIRPLPASGELIWYSEADGFAHLYLHDLRSGALKNRITSGKWMVREIIHVDEARRRILFLGSGFEDQADPSHRRLCAVNFDGSDFEIVLALDSDIYATEGDISATADPTLDMPQGNPFRPSYAPSGASASGNHVVVQAGSAVSATRTLLVDVEAGRHTELARNNADELWAAPKPQPFEVLASDGLTKLCGTMLLPSDFDPHRSYPLIDNIYPGPHVNWYIRRFPSWPALDLQSLVELGMVGIVLETRGMPNRNRAFHQAGHGGMLEPQLSDHVAAIEQLCKRHGFIDRDRIGIFGQSGGGYATARAMFDYPGTFKVGVAVCGNHDNRNYMAYWIDKYGPRPGTPERETQSNVQAAHRLQGKLLVIHGEMDENVHPAHTLALCDALIAAGKDFEQLIVPNAGHMLMLEKPYVAQRLRNFLLRNLFGIEPPSGSRIDWTPTDAAAAMRMVMHCFA